MKEIANHIKVFKISTKTIFIWNFTRKILSAITSFVRTFKFPVLEGMDPTKWFWARFIVRLTKKLD